MRMLVILADVTGGEGSSEAWCLAPCAPACAARGMNSDRSHGFLPLKIESWGSVIWYNSNCTKERFCRTIQVPGTGWNQPCPRPLKHQLSPCVDCTRFSKPWDGSNLQYKLTDAFNSYAVIHITRTPPCGHGPGRASE